MTPDQLQDSGLAPVRLTDETSIRAWSQRFGVSERALTRAVARVGERFRDVQRELGGRR